MTDTTNEGAVSVPSTELPKQTCQCGHAGSTHRGGTNGQHCMAMRPTPGAIRPPILCECTEWRPVRAAGTSAGSAASSATDDDPTGMEDGPQDGEAFSVKRPSGERRNPAQVEDTGSWTCQQCLTLNGAAIEFCDGIGDVQHGRTYRPVESALRQHILDLRTLVARAPLTELSEKHKGAWQRWYDDYKAVMERTASGSCDPSGEPMPDELDVLAADIGRMGGNIGMTKALRLLVLARQGLVDSEPEPYETLAGTAFEIIVREAIQDLDAAAFPGGFSADGNTTFDHVVHRIIDAADRECLAERQSVLRRRGDRNG